MSDAGTGDAADKVVRQMEVVNQLGFHARPAALFAKIASRYDCDITVKKGGNQVSGKSLMGLLGLEAGCGTEITVVADGPDAAEAVTELEELVSNGFGHE